ncbi:MAG TPA: hypothetical protein VF239_16690, partial [Vicinamibacterales bacterium]
ELQIADVRAQVMFSLFTDFKNFSEFTPDARHEPELNTMLQQLVAWGEAMKTVREQAAKRAA